MARGGGGGGRAFTGHCTVSGEWGGVFMALHWSCCLALVTTSSPPPPRLRTAPRSGCLAHMAQAGVECLDVYCVDNILAKLGDPLFLGEYLGPRSVRGGGGRVLRGQHPGDPLFLGAWVPGTTKCGVGGGGGMNEGT